MTKKDRTSWSSYATKYARQLLAEAVEKGEMAALEGGPRDGFWYWRTWMDRQQRDAGWGPQPGFVHYTPTGRWTESPNYPPVQGRVWAWDEHLDNPRIAGTQTKTPRNTGHDGEGNGAR